MRFFISPSHPLSNCFYVENSVCISSQEAIIGKDNLPDNLIGLWTFDDQYAADHSGFKNFIQPAPKVGPSAGNFQKNYILSFFQVEEDIPHILMEQI